ncbi:MAG: DUF4445 domain-containing protein [Kiritimatiellae bacterium]|nr:DUF4445 domain-containing protein [Kiritimatiellia bacterium]
MSDPMKRPSATRCNGHCAKCPRRAACPARSAARESPVLLSGERPNASSRGQDGVGFAVDVGSTTLAVGLYDLRTGALLSNAGCANPQSDVSTDVIGRISAAESPGGLKRLRHLVLDALEKLAARACASAGVAPDDLSDGVVTGNTVMLHLFAGRSPSALGRVPFHAEWLAGCEETFLGHPVWLPPCVGAFVGADLVCALIAAGLDQDGPTALLCDIGTNAEVAVRTNGTVFATSTAAGPAFEGTGVRGSELLDAIAGFLASGAIEESGASVPGSLVLKDGRTLDNADVRAVQMAKAAVAAGISVMLDEAVTCADDLSEIFLAGGFGCGLNPDSAAAIGMLPSAPKARKTPIGNAALAGAATLLLHPQRRESALRLAHDARLVELGGNADFSDRFIDAMAFGELACFRSVN